MLECPAFRFPSLPGLQSPLFCHASPGFASPRVLLTDEPSSFPADAVPRRATASGHIPPGTGHRGLDVLVNVLTIPGFKPHSEYYLDRDIRDTTGGTAPYNENLLDAKNYTQIEDLLEGAGGGGEGTVSPGSVN